MSSSCGGFKFGAIMLIATAANHYLLLLRGSLERDRGPEDLHGPTINPSLTSLRGSIIFFVMGMPNCPSLLPKMSRAHC